MQDNVSVLIATILAVIIIVLFPIYNVATRQDSIANNMVVRATTNFVDEVRNKGYIEATEYGNYLNELDKTGNIYEVEMEVYKPILISTASEEYEEKYDIKYTNGILTDMRNADLVSKEDSVINDDIYYLSDGYKFYVRVKNTNITQAQILFDRIFRGKNKERIVVNYGGVVYSNEWAKGDNAEIAGTNISISRPMDYTGKEFKYEEIAGVYDELTGETKMIYGIAVRLSDVIPNASKIKFLLTYNDIEEFEDASGRKLTTSTARENHIKEYFETEGFDSDITVEEKDRVVKNGRCSYEYMITLDNISYNFSYGAYARGSVHIKAGSAYSRAGALGLLNSKEFIITYEMSTPTITMTATPDVITENVILPVSGGTNITFKAKGELESASARIKEIVFSITNNDVVVKTATVAADLSGRASTSYKFNEGTGSITAYAVDTRGNKSETIGYAFIIMNNYLSQSINKYGITEMKTVIINGATISSYSFGGSFPYHGGTDWWRVTGLVKGTSDTWEVVNPTSGTYIPWGETLRANYATGSNFNTGTVSLEDPKRYIQLKFEYRTDPTHDGQSCLRGATIEYKVNYKF